MKVVVLLISYFVSNSAYRSGIVAAVSDGIMDVFKEMGYQSGDEGNQ